MSVVVVPYEQPNLCTTYNTTPPHINTHRTHRFVCGHRNGHDGMKARQAVNRTTRIEMRSLRAAASSQYHIRRFGVSSTSATSASPPHPHCRCRHTVVISLRARASPRRYTKHSACQFQCTDFRVAEKIVTFVLRCVGGLAQICTRLLK